MSTKALINNACLFGLLLALPVSAGAQEADDDQARLERVEITGTRIRQADVAGLFPVDIVSREDMQRSGTTSIGDFLLQLTISGSALNTKFNSSGNFGFPPDGCGVGAGEARVNLRHLGAKRTLVLVDGQRWVSGSSGSGVCNATDLNTIPMAVVERIELLKDGASAIYGSDAIAGVVNIITRKEFDGFEANVYYGQFEQGDGESTKVDISYGLVEERSSVYFNISHTDQNRVSAADRDISRFPKPNTGLTRGSSGTPQGRFLFINPDDAGGLCPGGVCNITTPRGSSFAGGVPTFPNDFIPFTLDERFNYATYNLVLTPSERTSMFGHMHFDVAPAVRMYVRGLYTNRQSVNQAAPEPIFIGPEAGTGGIGDTVTIDVTNPYNPLGYTLDSSNFIFIGRRPLEGGPRVFEQNVDTMYVGAGVQGDFSIGGNPFFWDVNASYSRNHADQTTYGSYNIRRIANALGPVADCNADPFCVPLNIFGGAGTITQDMLGYIQPVLHDVSENAQRVYSANISGDLFEMPAGPFTVAAGLESRSLSGYYQPDALVVAGESNGVPSLPTSGAYDVDEAYLETNIPLLANITAVEQLDLSLALRRFDYSTFGSDTTSKIGLQYRPNSEWLFRTSLAEGFRAPAIGELFGTASRFDAELADPCSNHQGTSFEDECTALGVPTTYTQLNSQISVTTGGNEQLTPELSDSVMFGIVYSPEWAAGLSWANRLDFELTYYEHEIEDAIQPIDAQFKLNQCVASADSNSDFCQGISRTAGGSISGFNNRLTNIGGVETSGFDFNIAYASPEYAWGQLTVNWNHTFVNDYEEILPSGERRALEGREFNDTAIPEWQWNLITNWTYGKWAATWTMRYVDELTESCSDFLDGSSASLTALGLCSDPAAVDQDSENKLDSTLYNDIVATYFVGDGNLSISFGINNVFDEDPPICYSCSLNGYDASTYDVPGRFYYMRASWRP